MVPQAVAFSTGRFAVAAFAVAAAIAPAAPAGADTSYRVFVGDRRLDAGTPSGLSHRGTLFVNVVRVTKAFSGLLTFEPSGSALISLGGHKAKFTVGSNRAVVDDNAVTLAGAPFVLNGDTFVPLATLAQLAGATYTLDAKHHLVSLVPPGASSGAGANVAATPAPPPPVPAVSGEPAVPSPVAT